MKEEIKQLLSDWKKQEDVERYAAYCQRLLQDKTKDGKIKNSWFQQKKAPELAGLFKRVAADGLVFDGKHVTFTANGINYDYVAYKNKMLITYPESKVDIGAVMSDDEFKFDKNDGRVTYNHSIKNPFNNIIDDNIVGAYCVIKNNRGEFLTLMSKEEIVNHRKLAKTDNVWQSFFREMILKTVIKKACKQHFDDVYTKIEELDNENYDLDNPVELKLTYKQEIDGLDTVEQLQDYLQANRGQGKAFDSYILKRINEVTQKN